MSRSGFSGSELNGKFGIGGPARVILAQRRGVRAGQAQRSTGETAGDNGRLSNSANLWRGRTSYPGNLSHGLWSAIVHKRVGHPADTVKQRMGILDAETKGLLAAIGTGDGSVAHRAISLLLAKYLGEGTSRKEQRRNPLLFLLVRRSLISRAKVA